MRRARPKFRPARRPPRGGGALREAAAAVLAGWGLAVVPRIPQRLKRWLLRRRSIVIDGNTLDTTLQFMLALRRVAGIGALVATPDPTVARRQLRALSAKMPRRGGWVDTAPVAIPGPAGDIAARHYRPPRDATAAPLVVFFHGGGFVMGDLDSHDDLCRLLCRDARVHVLSIDYRLAPEHPAPAAVDDAFAAYRWALAHAADLGAHPARIAVAGDSAGGNLAAVVSVLARDGGVALPALQVLIYPVTDMAHPSTSRSLFTEGFFLDKVDIDWFKRCYLGDAAIDATDPRVSPLLEPDLTGLPPALVLTAGFDPLRDEGNAYAARLAAAGTAVDLRQMAELVHGFASFFALGGHSAAAVSELTSAIRAHLSRR